ncbi:hypothetical protein LF1_21250 [Rubripirellula obstinata]|uniref:DUF4914 domain-containing protein n=1 Tax=Rubripirellula obstinata TaxID=406547 RepID=A0A5B1CHA0_9BACT|nr:DUF4914 family protein [Rubripirellula obstinata]KAA1259591.1 hypothetical protein LF1_21250 [Rubripirellula obstinata]
MFTSELPNLSLSRSAELVLSEAKSVRFFNSAAELVEASVPEDLVDEQGYFTVGYEVDGKMVPEVKVCRVKNGISANYIEPYMRRRDSECMVIADDRATDKTTYKSRFNEDFEDLRQETFAWLKQQDLACFFFDAGREGKGLPALVICPANAGFFALGLAMLQGIIPMEEIEAKGEKYHHSAIIYIAPPFRHTHFGGKQVVVHNRREELHELYSYNLYPGPSAKKGVYGMLLTLGEKQDWTTAHCSTVQVVTPYDNTITIMHEGASGGGKSEMLEQMHRQSDGRLLLGTNTTNGEKRHLALPLGCELRPVTDDMALCHPDLQDAASRERKLTVVDAEHAWFLRVNHITKYGTDPHLEGLTIHPDEPLLFLNIDATPGSTALIWDHIEDEPGSPCPNPRLVFPRSKYPGIVNDPVTVDIRSFGVRCPPCTKQLPTYGIMGIFHVLPPSLAWLWRLVAPRGHGNPSIVDTEGMSSEGVGSYWPFATGRRVDQANILLHQVLGTPDTLYVLVPNQHIGCWETGFAPQWIAREYLSRRGSAPFAEGKLTDSRCSLLGQSPKTIQVEGQTIGHWFLHVETQPEVGTEGYDRGAEILTEFFHQQIQTFLDPDLDPKGREIIEACLAGATVDDYVRLSQ